MLAKFWGVGCRMLLSWVNSAGGGKPLQFTGKSCIIIELQEERRMMKSKVEQQEKWGTFFLLATIVLTVLSLARPALSQVGILGDWETGTYHTKQAGTNRALIFIAHVEEAGAINLSSVTYSGQSMIKIIDEIVGSSYQAYVVTYILDEANIAAATNGAFVPVWSASIGLPAVGWNNPKYVSAVLYIE